MRRILIPALCALAILAVPMTAMAASALPALFYDNGPNHLDDTDYEVLFNNDGTMASAADHTLAIGDILVGIFGIQTVYDVDDPPAANNLNIVVGPTFSAAFAVKVSDVVAGFVDFTYLSDAEWNSLAGTAAGLFADVGLPTRTSSTTMVVVFDDPSGISQAEASLKDSVDTADGVYLWELGFAGDGGEFWRTNADPNILAIDQALALFQAALNITATPGASAPFILKHSTITFSPSLLGGGTLADVTQAPVYVQLSGNLQSLGLDAGWFDVQSDSSAYIVPTPEPGSLALLGLGIAAIGGTVYRRRKNKARA